MSGGRPRTTPSGPTADPEVGFLGRVAYRHALRLQRLRREAVVRGDAPEVLWLLEHDPVVTLGRRAAKDERLVASLRAQRRDVVATERGGLATAHGPGQLVGYPIVHLRRRGWHVRRVVHGLEEGLIRWLGGQGIAARRREGWPGVWVGDDKIAALGLHVSRDVTLHGFALNLQPDLGLFDGFAPCGVTEGGVTSVARLLGAAPAPHQVAEEVGRAVLAGIRSSHR